MGPYLKSRMSGKRGRWAVPLVLLVIVVVASVPGIGYADDPLKVPPGAFKTATTCSPSVPDCLVPINFTGFTNILSLSITAPAAGFVYVSAIGFCFVNTFQPQNLLWWQYIIGTSANDPGSPEQPQVKNVFAERFPLVIDRVLSVSAGANTFFLTVEQAFAGSLLKCTGRMTAFFTTTMLP